MLTKEQQETLKEGIASLIDSVSLEKVVGCAVPLDTSSTPEHPRTALLYVRFSEEKPQVDALARFLWAKCVNYALSRRRRIEFQKRVQQAPVGDMSAVPDLMRVVRDVFIEFREQYPSRSSEVGEVLAYCVAVDYLHAAQIAAKMSLKTSPNMPVHGLDGIHAVYEHGVLTVYFLESKMYKTANGGVKDYAESVAQFMTAEKQYLREYELVGDLGNLDSLNGEARELALQHFDVVGNPEFPRRERSVGVVCYTETKHFSNTIPVADGHIDAHEKYFLSNYAKEYKHHQEAARKHLKEHAVNPNKCVVFFVAVPDVDVLRERFYSEMGLGLGSDSNGVAQPHKARVKRQKK